MNDYSKNVNKLLEEYNDNVEKIRELADKIQIIDNNNLEMRAGTVFAFSLVPWSFFVLLLPTLVSLSIIPAWLIQPMCIIVSTIIGIASESLLSTKSKCKKKLKSFSRSKNQKQILEEQTRYEIEKLKLESINKVIDNVYMDLTNKNYFVNELSKDYNMLAHKNKIVEELTKEYNDTNLLFKEKQKSIEINATRVKLKDKICKYNDKHIFFSDLMSKVGISMLMSLCLYNIPVIFIDDLVNIPIQNSLYSIIGSIIVGGALSGGYLLKKKKDDIKVFNKINSELGEELFSEFEKDNENVDMLLEYSINDASQTKMELEILKHKLESIKHISNTSKTNDEISMKLIQNYSDILDKDLAVDENEKVLQKKIK